MVVIVVVGGGKVEVCDRWCGAGVRADVEEVVVPGEYGGEADGGAGGDVDCNEREFNVVVYRKEHRRGVLRSGVAQSLRRRASWLEDVVAVSQQHNKLAGRVVRFLGNRRIGKRQYEYNFAFRK